MKTIINKESNIEVILMLKAKSFKSKIFALFEFEENDKTDKE